MTKKMIVRLLIVALMVILLVLVGKKYIVKAAELTPAEKKIVIAKLEKLSAIEKGSLEVTVMDIKLAVGNDNRVYVKDKAPFSAKVGPMKYSGELNLKTETFIMPAAIKDHAKTRFGLAYSVTSKDKNTDKLDKGYLFLSYDALRYKRASATTIINFQRYGIGLGWKVTENSKLLFMGNWKFGEKFKFSEVMPLIGYGFNF